MSNFYELRYCDKCNQMTNHISDDRGRYYVYHCQKCGNIRPHNDSFAPKTLDSDEENYER